MIKQHHIAFDRRFRRSQDLQLTFETALVANVYVSMCDQYLYHNRTEDVNNSLSRGYTKNFWPLYRPLIQRLYADVEAYKKQDLSYNMHLCTFFFAEAVVRNEYNASCLKRHEKINKLDELVKDSLVINALKYVPRNELNTKYRAVYDALVLGNGNVTYHFLRKNEIKQKYFMPIIRKVLNNKIIEPIYVKIRHKG